MEVASLRVIKTPLIVSNTPVEEGLKGTTGLGWPNVWRASVANESASIGNLTVAEHPAQL